ncbi:large subunit ribosomal protein L29 [Hymenobacter luteus]|uniref:Large ribosomal subunit protein uL29 n=2 Tax=Hymenobacter TaxID=89966 RepID=A0A7W9SYS9_9BACT|nr:MULTISPECIES: 50S ribosomal protein L29 [Hymenobacter]MBB4600001.1 large subunit ribosomal protein L29 [Hymenobacter latericoloratus]MBB6057689.1 large subunit ribosomal protein L29 [Hymenobacter luteus]RPD49921.1 50S ribosomal protein L29 [Hymenobacter sediminis]
MKNTEIRALSLEDLKNQIKTEQTNGQTLRFAHAISPLENPIRLKQARKNVARLLTELKRRENEQATNSAN